MAQLRAAHTSRGALRVSLLVVLGAVAVGVVVAALGVASATGAVKERDEIADYSSARASATSRLDDAKQVVTLGQQLCGCDTQARDLARQQLDAGVANDVDRYNSLVEQRNALAGQGNDLLDQLRALR
jgi:hypothetical protein